MNLKDVFRSISIKMRADLELARASLSHAGLKGSSLENSVRTFLRQYVPDRFGITTGQVIDSDGSISKQLDVIIYDKGRTPILYDSGGIQVIPVECVYAVMEVKAKIDSAADLDAVHQNMLSVKRLKKSAYYYNEKSAIIWTNALYGVEWRNWPTQYYVFMFESCSVPRSLVPSLMKYQQADPTQPHMNIDMMYVLDRGLFLNWSLTDNRFEPLPTPTTTPVYIASRDSLLFFYTMFAHIINQARMPQFRFVSYMGNLDWNKEESTIG